MGRLRRAYANARDRGDDDERGRRGPLRDYDPSCGPVRRRGGDSTSPTTPYTILKGRRARLDSLRTLVADVTNIVAIRRPTAMSGHGEPVRATTPAAISTPALAITSLREHNHVERMLMSSPRRRQSRNRQTTLAAKARNPVLPMRPAAGTITRTIFSHPSPNTPRPKITITVPLSSAARACQTLPPPTT